jgi:hypothetical protein
MDMRIGLRESEDDADRNAEIWADVIAGGVIPRPQGHWGPDSFYGFLRTLQSRANMGRAFMTRPSIPTCWAA